MRYFTVNREANERVISWFTRVALVLSSAFLLTACGGSGTASSNATNTTNTTQTEEINLTQIAKDAYLYALPAVEHNRLLHSLINPGLVSSAPGYLTNLYSTTTLSTAASVGVVSPNIDTYYSSGVLDLTYEPVVITIPSNVTSDRYYSIQLLDIFTNSWYISSSANDTAGKYLVAHTDWNGVVPGDIIKVIRVPSYLVLALGRTQVFEVDDAIAKSIAKGFGTATLSGNIIPTEERARPKWVAEIPHAGYDSKTGDVEDFFQVFNFIVKYQILSDADNAVLNKFEIINIGANLTFNKSLFTAEEWDEIETGVFLAKSSLALSSPLVNGWSTSPQNAGQWGEDYLTRAAVAWSGIYANTPEEALYLSALIDENNETLNGANNYTITFAANEIPSVKFFWSLTLYKSNHFLYGNPLNRYGIRSFDTIDKEPDGSFTLYIQNENPGLSKENNWIPTPTDNFRLSFRLYGSNSNTPVLPPLVKIN